MVFIHMIEACAIIRSHLGLLRIAGTDDRASMDDMEPFDLSPFKALRQARARGAESERIPWHEQLQIIDEPISPRRPSFFSIIP